MNLFAKYRRTIEQIVRELGDSGFLPKELDTEQIAVEPPRDRSHGDIATNAAMVLAKKAMLKPRIIAEEISKQLRKVHEVETVDVAGPGFINLRVNASVWQRQIELILEAGESYGDCDLGGGRSINLEFVSANPTGPMHVGHARGAVIGDVLAELLGKAGFDVTREYYINDAGAQIDSLARSVHFRYREALGEEVGKIPDELYPGDYLIDIGRRFALEHRDSLKVESEADWLPPIREFVVEEMMSLIRDDLDALGISHNVFSSEAMLHRDEKILEVVNNLENRNLVYWGRLEVPKGKKSEDWEDREQYLFRSTLYGDDVDRPLKKSDGTWTYFAADVAYHLDKFERGFDEMIDIWGADHKGYIKRMQAAVEASTGGEGSLDVRICNLVNLMESGKPVRMSKRTGKLVTLREVVDEVGKDVVRFMMLIRNNDAPLDFDLKQVADKSRDNPVFYVQYAHARACSVLRNVQEVFPGLALDDADLATADMSLLADEAELALIRLLAGWPRLVETAASAREPHRVAYFLQELAAEFHGLWNMGHEDPTLRFLLAENESLTRSRTALVRGVCIVIASGLQVMGVTPVEEMR